jgi:hypothetical protein
MFMKIFFSLDICGVYEHWSSFNWGGYYSHTPSYGSSTYDASGLGTF